MNVRLESICHGDGKVYLQLVIDKMRPDAFLRLEALLKDESVIPSHLFPFTLANDSSLANYIVVLPFLSVREVDLVFTEYEKGEPVETSCLTVELNSVRLRTRINSLVRNELITDMLDIEHEYCAERMSIYFSHVIETEDSLVVKMLVDMPKMNESNVLVRFMDARGKEIDLPVFPLFEEVCPAQRFGDKDRLQLGFSVLVDKTDKDFCVIAYDEEDRIPGGFGMFCDETYRLLWELFKKESCPASEDPRYGEWLREHEPSLADIALQRSNTLPFRPTISLVLPLVSCNKERLCEVVDPIMNQTYGTFELIVVDACLNDDTYKDYFSLWEEDSRIKRIKMDDSSTASAVVLTGLLQSQGEYCAVVSQEVLLASDALFEYVRRLNELKAEDDINQANGSRYKTCVLYSDHDDVDSEGYQIHPHLKPEYSPDYLYSFNYFGLFVMLSRGVIDSIAKEYGFTAQAFSYDLALKSTLVASCIEHIPLVLYHVYPYEEEIISSNMDINEFMEDRNNPLYFGRKVLAAHLLQKGIKARVLIDAKTESYTVDYYLEEDDSSTVSILIPTKDQSALLERCITSIMESNSFSRYEIVIIDNQSVERETFNLYAALQSSSKVSVRLFKYDKPFHYARMINAAARTCKSDYLLLMHNDTEMITENALEKLIGQCSRGDIGVVGGKLLFADQTVQHAGYAVGKRGHISNIGAHCARTYSGYEKRFVVANNVSAVSGACLMVKRTLFEKLGGLEERFNIYYSDIDFCLRVLKEGYYVAINPSVELFHRERATLGHEFTPDQQLRIEKERAFFQYRWPRYSLEGDPFIGRNISSQTGYFSLNFDN